VSYSKREWEKWMSETKERKAPPELAPLRIVRRENFLQKIFRKLFGRKP